MNSTQKPQRQFREHRFGEHRFVWIGVFFFLMGALPAPFPLQAQAEVIPFRWPLIVGTEQGLFGINRFGAAVPLWTGGAVRKILHRGGYWILLSDQGVLVSEDLRRWEPRNRGLPVKTIKIFEGGKKSFITQIQEIKDLELNPDHPEIMVCATNNGAFLSKDRGLSWESLGSLPYKTNGVKAVAAAYLPELTIFLSHSIYGLHYLQPDREGAVWSPLNAGLERLETTGNTDEVSDIAVVPAVLPPAALTGGASPEEPEIYVSQTFRRRIYRLDWREKRFISILNDGSSFGTIDSLDIDRERIRFVKEGAVMELRRWAQGEPEPLREDVKARLALSRRAGLKANCAVIWINGFLPHREPIVLSELWLLDDTPQQKEAFGREGLYLPVDHALDPGSLKSYLDIITERNLNMVVIDMKDDYGRLRFSPEDPAIIEKGRVFRPVDIETFLAAMKERGIYTVARIVVFKDPELAGKEEGKYAVWDERTNRPWVGYFDAERRTSYDERWVDPYSEEVWDYIAAVAGELHRRGFDEIQFDYIRFPTDGENLADARYRWQDTGMDRESAILSFLRHIRKRIKASLSIDIYGANGWYRTGARTGQEVELLAPYVDVICPMYYPSHFEQEFLAQSPAELRPYRIYFLGVQRAHRIARGQITVRPYAQAFYLNVSYDRRYYNENYVRLEVEGVRDAGNPGFTYWNNAGRYDDIP
ncbi:MAG: hypothetical protein LBG76_08130 [Treponema sp.]|jgi:hypothetical protein|nr:hypothetical protein [Treponema sp.]